MVTLAKQEVLGSMPVILGEWDITPRNINKKSLNVTINSYVGIFFVLGQCPTVLKF